MWYITFPMKMGRRCNTFKDDITLNLWVPSALERIMVETDAAFVEFKKKECLREHTDCMNVAETLAETIDVPTSTVCDVTTANALRFLELNRPDRKTKRGHQ